MATDDWPESPTGGDDWGDDGNDGWDDDPDGAEDGWEMDDAKGASIDAMTQPDLQRAVSYFVHTTDKLRDQREKLIMSTCELLSVTREEADCLLRHYGWKNNKLQADWFENPMQIRQKVGLTHTPKVDITKPPAGGLWQCSTAYCDKVPPDQAFATNCGHVFCVDCWKGFVLASINDGMSCVFATCPGMACEKDHAHKFGCACHEMVPASVFRRFISDEKLLGKYDDWVLNSFVEGQRSVKWCPQPNCGNTVEYKAGGARTVECKCGFRWCFMCREEEHVPAPCDLVSKWRAKEQSDDATQLWLAARTKKCPKCSVHIEKNKACNHMTCAKCGHHFCWLCKGPWSQHGSSSGGYYVCNKYNEEKSKGNLSAEEKHMAKGNALLGKYIFYNSRYQEALRSYKLTEKQLRKLEERITDVQKYGFVVDAYHTLLLSHQVLRWTYCMAYYMKAGSEKDLFEYQQSMLQSHTEHLQEILEMKSFEDIPDERKQVVTLTGSVGNFRKHMVEEVERGTFEHVLLNEADAHSAAWGCTNCKKENRPDIVLCKHCGGCKLHGEQDCKACKKDS
jgi:ariadne-1